MKTGEIIGIVFLLLLVSGLGIWFAINAKHAKI
jgi:hypothetical protein